MAKTYTDSMAEDDFKRIHKRFDELEAKIKALDESLEDSDDDGEPPPWIKMMMQHPIAQKLNELAVAPGKLDSLFDGLVDKAKSKWLESKK